jgi:two-component system cell cycle response regulator
MSARILIVDDLAPNLHLLEAKLEREYYDVLKASSGEQALKIAATEKIDLVLLDAMMPGMNGFEVCEHLKSDPKTWHVPVVMVTALEETKDRVRGLEAGADDFITKPIDDFNMKARVKSLLRLKMVTDQLLSHSGHTVQNSRPMIEMIEKRQGNILIVDSNERHLDKLSKPLSLTHKVITETDGKAAVKRASHDIDLVIVNIVADNLDGLRVCASLRANKSSREIPILAIGDAEDEETLVRGYDLGVNDTLMRPVEEQELMARVSTQLKRKFYADSLRENFNESLEMVVTDPLTGLGNRRHFDRGILPLIEQVKTGTPFSMIVFDVDHFKRVNDILGHDVGDDVLKRVAARLASNLRAIDIVSRYGGEEFIIAMPDTLAEDARIAADRIRSLISGTPVYVDGQALSVTVSAGVAQANPGERARDIFKRADEALYTAKKTGRNKVMAYQAREAA